MSLKTGSIDGARSRITEDARGHAPLLTAASFARAWAAAGEDAVVQRDVVRDWSLRLGLCSDEELESGKVQVGELIAALEQLGYFQAAAPAPTPGPTPTPEAPTPTTPGP